MNHLKVEHVNRVLADDSHVQSCISCFLWQELNLEKLSAANFSWGFKSEHPFHYFSKADFSHIEAHLEPQY